MTSEFILGRDIRPAIRQIILKDQPDFNDNSKINLDDLNRYRRNYLTQLLEQDKGELARLDRDVILAMNKNQFIAGSLLDDRENQLTFGERMADRIAEFGGSWRFLIIFFGFLILWMIINTYFLSKQVFDPYPFILLNLILSCIAAIQAPIIMMSQNRQEQKDRKRAENDYKINLKAELEIKLLHEKIDHLLVQQNQRLLEIQQMQIDYLEDLMKQNKNSL